MKPQNLIDKIIISLYQGLFLLAPLIMASITSELFEFNKIIFIYFVTTLILFLWILKMIIFKKIILKRTIFDIPILIFFLSQLASTIFSIDRHTSIFGYYGRFNGGLLSIIAYIILFYGFISNFNLGADLKPVFTLLKTSLLSSLVVILWGLPGKFGYDLSCLLFMGQFNNSCWTDQFRPAERMFSTLGQPNWLGAYLAINFFIGLWFILKNKENKYFIFYILYLILNFSSILFTRSRSALLATLIGIILFTGYYLFFIKINRKKILVGLLITTILPIILFKTGIDKIDNILKFSINNPQLSNKAQIADNQPPILSSGVTESFDIRKIVWKGALELGKRYPFFGTGVETFGYAYYFVRPREHNLTSEWDFLYNKAHNEYLNYFATTGFFGLGAYLILIISIVGWVLYKLKVNPSASGEKLKITIKNSKLEKNETIKQLNNIQLLRVCLLLAYISILITNFFGFSTTTINLFFYLIPGFLLVLDKEKQLVLNQSNLDSGQAINNQQLSINLSSHQKIAIFFLSLFIFYFLYFIFSYWLADTLYAKANLELKNDRYQKAAALLQQSLKLKYEHVYEDKLSYILANLAVLSFSQKQEDLTKKLMALSSYYNQKSLSVSPKNILYWKTKAKNHYLFYQINLNKDELEKGIFALKEGKKLSPTDPKIPYSLAIFYSLLVDEEKNEQDKLNLEKKSLIKIEEAIKLKPNYRDGYFLKGQLLEKYGKKEKAREAFQFILNNINPQDGEVKKELERLNK